MARVCGRVEHSVCNRICIGDSDGFDGTAGFMSTPFPQAVATDFQNESAAALAAAATRHLQEAEQTKDSGAEHW